MKTADFKSFPSDVGGLLAQKWTTIHYERLFKITLEFWKGGQPAPGTPGPKFQLEQKPGTPEYLEVLYAKKVPLLKKPAKGGPKSPGRATAHWKYLLIAAQKGTNPTQLCLTVTLGGDSGSACAPVASP